MFSGVAFSSVVKGALFSIHINSSCLLFCVHGRGAIEHQSQKLNEWYTHFPEKTAVDSFIIANYSISSNNALQA